MGTLVISIERAAIIMAALVREGVAFTAVETLGGTDAITIKMTGF